MKNIPEELIPLIDYWERHGKATVAVAIAALAVGVGLWAWDRARAEARQEVCDTLVRDYRAAGGAAGAEELQDAIEKAVDPAVVPLLKLRLAKMHYAAGEYEAAGALYDELLPAPPKGYEDAPAFGRAATLEAKGEFAAAQKAFEEFGAAFPASVLGFEAEMGAVRCLAQAGNKDEALKRIKDRRSALEALAADGKAKAEALRAAQAAVDELARTAPAKGDAAAKAYDEKVAAAELALASAKRDSDQAAFAVQDKDDMDARLEEMEGLVKRWEGRKATPLLANLLPTPLPEEEAEKPAAAAAPKAEAPVAEAPKAAAPAAETPKAEPPASAPQAKKAE